MNDDLKKREEEAQISNEVAETAFWYYTEIVSKIKDSRTGIGYLTIKDIARALEEAMGEDFEYLIKELCPKKK